MGDGDPVVDEGRTFVYTPGPLSEAVLPKCRQRTDEKSGSGSAW
jgi:hypothetical protein